MIDYTSVDLIYFFPHKYLNFHINKNYALTQIKNSNLLLYLN